MEITITDLDAKGHGIAHTERGDVLVPFAIPGDTVRVELRGKRKGVWRGQIIERTGASPNRVEPRCPYVGTCGGCPWQMIDYPAQLRYKREAVRRALHGLAVPEISEVLSCPEIFYYRNRMDYVIGAKGELGLKATEQWWNVLDLSTCFLLSPDAVEVMSRFRSWMKEHRVQPWDNQTHHGFARYLVIREGKRTNERFVMVVTAPGELPGRDDLIAKLKPLATSILWGINPRITDLSIADEVHVLHGSEALRERLLLSLASLDVVRRRDSYRQRDTASSRTTAPNNDTSSDAVDRITTPFVFDIPPNAFFQTNTLMAERLVETVREFAALSGTELVVDLYCGVGVFGIALASRAQRVVGVESDPSAIPIAQRNAMTNGVTNAQFQLALAEKWPFPIDPVDVLIVDPPRAGLHPRVIQKILAMEPRRIIYVSCSPTALARDLKPLLGRYACDAIRCLDLFPHTPHVETVVRLVKHKAA
jgi:tRNA/tmRNA/rRNA uracil-C5-methylase (TrmA/RlmC/RlmD family)